MESSGAVRWVWIAAMVAGVSYSLAAWSGWDGGWVIAWKGAGVGLLAVWAAVQARGTDGWLIAGMLALGALGDVLLASVGLTVGAVAFLAGHVVAIMLYRRYARGALHAPVLVIPGATIGLAAALTHDVGVAIYAAGLGTMAECAWGSRFPRRVAWGAVLFVVSDVLIFARMGVLADSIVPTLLVWPTYFAAQALIAHGVVWALREEAA
ncbi:lysoplasmalogenase family protein [Sphingomonas donggukensis]|uniref:Lysoplasmalogenase family protein n=1 Tax=Sphingomonas donggukensis TaxID=2949093 RepID=A0ABY4TX39_9SPHN|nr:lysoplasmalogenase family protein [Sphingomonas donggukensis]URW76967.1 lysoplasmalogenase family protein [Sphingomonas donggukensis]